MWCYTPPCYSSKRENEFANLSRHRERGAMSVQRVLSSAGRKSVALAPSGALPLLTVLARYSTTAIVPTIPAV